MINNKVVMQVGKSNHDIKIAHNLLQFNQSDTTFDDNQAISFFCHFSVTVFEQALITRSLSKLEAGMASAIWVTLGKIGYSIS